MHFNLDRLWELAREADRDCLRLYHRSAWVEFHKIILWRNAVMRMIFEHPANPYSYMAVLCRTISGLSGREDELKPNIKTSLV
jgi:hypothetical protein